MYNYCYYANNINSYFKTIQLTKHYQWALQCNMALRYDLVKSQHNAMITNASQNAAK